MNKILTGFIIATFTLGMGSAFAANDALKHRLDERKAQAKIEYEHRKDELNAKYKMNDLKNELLKAESDYRAKAHKLDALKNQPDEEAEKYIK